MDDRSFRDSEGSDRPVSLRDHPAAAVAIAEFLRVQERAVPRSPLARIFGAPVLSDESRPMYFGALGELAVADALGRLGAEWVVLHAIPVESHEASIDHVVTGPGGVFTLSSNYHSRQTVTVAERSVHVAGIRVNHIRDTEFDVGRVERRLTAAAGQPIHVVGVIVVVEPRSLTVHGTPRDIAVLRADELVEWLRARPPVLGPECVSKVADVAGRPSTWGLGPVCVVDGARLVTRFEAVRSEVTSATVRSRLWFVAVSAALIGILVVAALGVLMQTATG